MSRQLVLPDSSNGQALPPRLEQVLHCLLTGDSEKQVAGRLKISANTVNRHVQRLYRRFGVHSRAELMFQCRERRPVGVSS
jgi:DNA-binding NarL/FixJ family response regulator